MFIRKRTARLAMAIVLFGFGAAGCEREPDPTPAPVLEDVAPIQRKAPDPAEWSGRGCTSSACHGGIEPIRQLDTGMMRAILARGEEVGDPDGCVVCHGGQPGQSAASDAHRSSPPTLVELGGPRDFLADPASPWVNDRTCGQCHAEQVSAQWNSLMMTEAGKIQGTTWSFGSLEGYEHRWANYATENPDDPHARLGTDVYRAYMEEKSRAHPNVFVDSHEPLPEAPQEGELRSMDAEAAVFTYIRSECQRCHLGVKGRAQRGDYRGMGCGACHMPYGNEGVYEGEDKTIGSKPGKPLVHTIQATRGAEVWLHGESYSGIPVETCTTCHNRGKRIGVSYQGLMEKAWGSPYTEGGGGQLGLHSKHYIAMEKDVHYERGMLCQDCHTSGDVHGDRFLAGANLGPIEIECSDCHGTPTAYPWELPLGWGDENGADDRKQGPARGVGQELAAHLEKGDPAPVRDGYVLTARGNPMPDVVRDGDQLIIHTAAGRDLRLDPLKRKHDRGELSAEAEVAMVHAAKHMETMECYACHSSWAPQCYGCHIQVDYSSDQKAFDWVAAGRRHLEPDHRRDPDELSYDTLIPGKVTEMRSFMRWEDPVLGVNGEGRVSPLIPGCQVSATVIGPDGEEIARNHVFRTDPGTEGGGPDGQLGVDMSPVQPHTVGKARSCESCHGSAKAMGYGIGGTLPPEDGAVVDLTTADGRVIPNSARFQSEPVDGVKDWSAVVDRETGAQLQTVGHHFQGSGPLSEEQRRNMDRENVCVACHIEIPDRSLAVSVLHHVAEVRGELPETKGEHDRLVHKILLTTAWGQVLGGVAGGLVLGGFGVLLWRRRRRR